MHYQKQNAFAGALNPLARKEQMDYIVKKQRAFRNEISIVLIANLDTQAPSKALSYKVPRFVGEEIQRRLDNGHTSLTVIRHHREYKIRPITKLILKPTDKDLSYPMRWAHSMIGDSPFTHFRRREMGEV